MEGENRFYCDGRPSEAAKEVRILVGVKKKTIPSCDETEELLRDLAFLVGYRSDCNLWGTKRLFIESNPQKPPWKVELKQNQAPEEFPLHSSCTRGGGEEGNARKETAWKMAQCQVGLDRGQRRGL